MANFTRYFYKPKSTKQAEEIRKLRDQPWFHDLERDVKNGEVFPALRYDNMIDFYYLGARLCRYKSTKREWFKGATDPESADAYDKIKQACRDWASKTEVEALKNVGKDRERAELACLYQPFSPYTNARPDLILLDIEVGFPKLYVDGKFRHNNIQIDLLFLDPETGVLYFIEGKHAGDHRVLTKIRKGERSAEICKRQKVFSEQLVKYNDNLKYRNPSEITVAYTEHIHVMGEIFSHKFSFPELHLHPTAKILVYGNSSSVYSKGCIDALHTELGTDFIRLEDPAMLSKDAVVR